MEYRKDIDGLRAIAVLLVIFDHMKISFFEGGFIGVDIFFVISGFLITSIIKSKLDKGTFSFSEFYNKRIKRIFPVLIFVLSVATAINLAVLFPEQLKQYLNFVPYAIFAIGNIAAANLDQGYFDQSVERHQLLHTWSLGVEEQFYVIIPLFLFILWKIKSTKIRGIIILLTFLLSVLVSIYFVSFTDLTTSNYYLLHTRFFEIFIGVTLAFFFKDLPKVRNQNLASGLSLISILLILFLGYYFSGASPWPGLNALYVVFLSGLIIYLGAPESKNIVSETFLASSAMTFIGRISYSLYLWHWIFISLLYEMGYDMEHFSIFHKLLMLLLFFVPLSYFSWKYVENNFRYDREMGLLKSFALWVLLPLVLGIGLLQWGNNSPSDIYDRDELDQSSYRLVSRNTVHRVVQDINLTTKELSLKHERNEIVIGDFLKKFDSIIDHDEVLNTDVLILGNSHYNPFKKYLDQQLREAGLVGHVMEERTVRVYSEEKAEEIYSTLLKNKKYLVIMVRHTGQKFGQTDKDWREWLIDKSIALGIQPIIMVPGIEIKEETTARRNYYHYKIFNEKFLETLPVDSIIKTIPSLAEVETIFNKYGEKVRWIDFKPLLIEDDKIHMWYNDEFILFDSHHLTRKTGLKLGLEYSMRYGNIFSGKWQQPPVLFHSPYYYNSEMFLNQDLLFRNDFYEINVNKTLPKLYVRKRHQGLVDEHSNYFLHIFPSNIQDLPERRRNSGFDNIRCREQTLITRIDKKKYSIGEFYLPNYAIDSIKVGHYDITSGERKLDVNLKFTP